MRRLALLAQAFVAVFGSFSVAPAKAIAKHTIYLSMSYVGNGWQNEATNLIKAMAAYYSDEVDLHIQVAGPVARRQSQQIGSMVPAGADAIIVYPISPTALNNVIQSACRASVVVFACDSTVTAPCACNVHPDQFQLGATAAGWVVDQMHGKVNALLVTGVPDTTVDTERTRAFMSVLNKHLEVKIIGQVNGMWSLAITEKVMTEFMATHKWSDIGGVIGTGGGWTAWQQEKTAGVQLARVELTAPTRLSLPCCRRARCQRRPTLIHRSGCLRRSNRRVQSDDAYPPVDLPTINQT